MNYSKSVFKTILRSTGILSPIRRLRTRIAQMRGEGYLVKVDLRLPTVFVGSEHAGYDVYIERLTLSSIVYSFGLGDDISFDLELIERFGLSVFGADPTPKSLQYLSEIELPKQFSYRDVAIAGHDGELKLFFPMNDAHVSLVSGDDGKRNGKELVVRCCSVFTFMREFGHEKIDILKMDIKGPEFEIITQLLENGIEITQLIVEFTPEIYVDGRSRVMGAIYSLRKSGFAVFAVSDDGRNISLINKDQLQQQRG